jgi:hypothetical protein
MMVEAGLFRPNHVFWQSVTTQSNEAGGLKSRILAHCAGDGVPVYQRKSDVAEDDVGSKRFC